ncbi:hypothetical protein MPC4_400017 [Methylocella tundrae]|uniref:Uncharacterized protein n=1 Tax=Methylocella tundrae TaxID=227605 RepID=A0A8B6MC84_METTU|nr:hypothetical protein MPC1_110020 [Methylocella tundrae]VTZ51616.1 hypothetical protein MPC4_400017 [Methylocella tundrae]
MSAMGGAVTLTCYAILDCESKVT